jgi:hypothetical protein
MSSCNNHPQGIHEIQLFTDAVPSPGPLAATHEKILSTEPKIRKRFAMPAYKKESGGRRLIL